jgi:hypothetical protein
MDIPASVRNAGREAVQTYRNALPYGERWAEMCALQIAPGTMGSDRAYMEGRHNNQQLDALPPRQAKYMAKEAREAGISIEGKYYCGGVANHLRWRDPEAWVSSNDDVLKVAKKRRMMVSGSVNYDPGVAPPQRKKINEKIVSEEVARIRRHNPKANPGELREQIIDRHSYKAKGR